MDGGTPKTVSNNNVHMDVVHHCTKESHHYPLSRADGT